MNINAIADPAKVSPQRTILASHPKKPRADSTLFLSRSVSANLHGGQHHTVVGVHIVLAAGNSNGLWDEFHIDRAAQKQTASLQKKDDRTFLMATRSLTICCDTLEIHGAFCLPEADVAIYARRLIWATEDAGINTSPLPWDIPKAPDAAGATPGENGANGRHAGSLKIMVAEIASPGIGIPRLIALGGRGQDPGNGLNGQPGKSMPGIQSASFEAHNLVGVSNTLKVNFSPPAVYINAKWYLGGSAVGIPLLSDPRGTNSFPTDGTDAVAPGTPGNGGNGGRLTTNSATVAAGFKSDGGTAGKTAPNCRGGDAGTPVTSAAYDLYMYFFPWKSTNKPNHDKNKKKPDHTTRKGNDAPARPAAIGAGTKAVPVLIECANAWLHPLSLQIVIEFARELFLAGDHLPVQALLENYAEGLALPIPESTKNQADSPWDNVPASQWTAAQTEIASMLQRLRAQLDYFGNPAGYTPLLSLQGSIKLYQGATRRALRTMLLAEWVNDETHKADQAVALFEDLIDDTVQDTKQAVDQVLTAEKKINQVTQELDGLEQNLTTIGVELDEKRTELLGQAETTKEQQALIKFSIKMAGAICQIIPVGQPALAAVGSLAEVSADLIGSDPESAPDTISRMGSTITKAREAANKSREASKKSFQEAKKGKPGDAAAASASASAMNQALDGLGPALTQLSGAVSALQVSQTEVEAELQRLEANCPELQLLLQEIRDLNARKMALFDKLAAAFHALGAGYARLAFNAAAIVSMQQEKGKQLSRIDHEASLFVRQLGRRSRLTLLRYLYYMVKAYETSLLQPLDDVDWQLTRVTAKINELLKEAKGFDGATLEDKARTLEVLFEENIDLIRQKLLTDTTQLGEVTAPRTLYLSTTQTPADLEALHRFGEVEIDPFAYGFVDARTQLARLSDADLEAVLFDPDKPQLPEGSQVMVDLIPSNSGTLRRAETLCAVYSEAPIRWNWTCSGAKIAKSLPSKGAEDLLDFILGENSDKIRQKIARPPFWSGFTIRARYLPPLANDKKPYITNLHFKFSTDVTAAPDHQSVLIVHPSGPSADSVVDCTPKDLAGREAGIGHFMRIYNQGADIQLTASAAANGTRFDHWQLIDAGLPDIYEPYTGKIRLKNDVIAQGYWARAQDQVARFNVLGLLSPAQLDDLAGTCPDDLRDALVRHTAAAYNWENLGFTAALPEEPGQPIRVEARPDASIVGCIPPGEEADLLQAGVDGWQEVNYRGISGWIHHNG